MRIVVIICAVEVPAVGHRWKGRQVTEIMLDLFSDVEPDSELFKQFSFISADDLPEFQHLLVRIRDTELSEISEDDKTRLLSQSFKLTIARHRLGLIDEDIQEKILQARLRIREESANHDLGIEYFRPRPFGQDGEEVGDVFDDLPGVFATEVTIKSRLPRLDSIVEFDTLVTGRDGQARLG